MSKRKLKHLPTKPTQVNPKSGTPFIRVRQHVNPNKDKPEWNTGQAASTAPTQMPRKAQSEQPAKGISKPKEFAKKLQEVNNGIPHEERPSSHVKAKTGFLGTAEREFDAAIPRVVREADLAPQSKKTTNGVYRVNKGAENEGYYKPDSQADNDIMGYIKDNQSGREGLAYEMSKIFGVEGLVPPTRVWSPEITEQGMGSKHGKNTRGSLMMSAQEFGEKHLELADVGQAFIATGGDRGLKKTYEDIKNIGDMVTFDFIIGNVDRHSLNFFIGKDHEGYKAIGIDHGFTFPEHAPDVMGKAYDWNNTIEHWRDLMKTGASSVPISTEFQAAILEFDAENFSKMAKEFGISDTARDGVLHRLDSVKEHTFQKYSDLQQTWQPEDFNSMEEYKGFLRQKLKITPYDIAQIAEKKYNTVIV